MEAEVANPAANARPVTGWRREAHKLEGSGPLPASGKAPVARIPVHEIERTQALTSRVCEVAVRSSRVGKSEVAHVSVAGGVQVNTGVGQARRADA